VYSILVHWKGADFKVVAKFTTLSRGGIVPTQLRVVSQLSSPVNIMSCEAFGISQSDSCLCLIRDMAVKIAQVDL
jgi:hypothetical protein